MRQPYPIEYYEGKLGEYSITPLSEWHGLRTTVVIHCEKHDAYRTVWLGKVFNGRKSTSPCRLCCFDREDESKW